MSIEQDRGGNEVLKKLLENSDLFGTGNESDSGSEGDSQPAASQQKASSQAWREEREEEGGEESSPSPQVEAKKGRKSRKETTKTAKPKKVKKAEVQMMYSDSQKLVRESSVNLPKYQSRTKTLDGFLSKLRNRKSHGGAATVGAIPSAVARMKTSTPFTDQETIILDKENDPPLPPASLETSTSPQELTSPSVDNMTGITKQEKSTPESTSTLDMYLSQTNALEEENTCACEMDTESKSDPNIETHGCVDEGERLEFEDDDNSKGTDQMATGVTEMETGDNNNIEGTLCTDLGEQKESTKIDTEKSDHLDSLTRDSDKKNLVPASEMRKTRQQPTLLTMFAANSAAAQQLKQQKSLKKQESTTTTKLAPSTSSSTPLPTPAPSLVALDEFLLENDDKMTVDVPVIPSKPLTPMERFQQRLMKHMSVSSSSSSQPVRRERESAATREGDDGKSILVPEDVITKLKDKPGAVREHWRSAIRQKLSKSRAEERKAMEERRKWYNEEVGGASDEEEAELTDGDTSDEEYIQDEEAAKADSDACSDFDDDEAEKEVEPEEADQSTNQEPDDHSDNDGDIDTDDDDDKDDTKNVISQSRKRTTASRRVLDSDSEDEDEMKSPNNCQSEREILLRQAESTSEHLCASSTVSDNTVYSALLFEDTRDCNEPITNQTVQRDEVKSRPLKKGGPRRRSSTTLGGALLEEASMPPLMLNVSVHSDESSESSFADNSEANGEMKATSSAANDEDLGFHSEDARQPFSTQPVREEEEGERDEAEGGGGEQDNSSLELSLLWQPSMPPPAQVRKDSSEELLPPTKRSRLTGESQWPARGYGDHDSTLGEGLSQDMSVDEETQLLDANGFLCVRSERKHRPSPFSAIKDSLDPTQEGCSQSELLALCSGQFAPDEDAQMVGGESGARDVFFAHHKRSLSDSSTQGVRELLGLTVESKKDNDRSKATDSIARLFSSFEGVSKSHASSNAGIGAQMTDGQNFTQMSEVIGLCSGVFPTTQMHQNDSQKSKSSFKLSSRMSSAGTSDGMSNHSSSEGEGERKEKGREQKMAGDQAVLRWAKRQRQLQLGVGGAKQGGGGGGGESESEDEDMPLLKRRRIRVKQKPSKQDRLAEFVESEAELSGSDVGSDKDEEDYLYAGQDYEDDEGAGSDLPLSDSELKEQINKVHMKHTLADDKADLREFKERFLKEGDLYEDGLFMKNGFFRTRHFNRNGGSEAGSLDLFADDQLSDGEGGGGGGAGADGGRAELNTQAEAKRRKDRLEREEFLRKFREKECSLLEMDEDSQSILGIIKDTSTSHSLLSTPSVSDKQPLCQMGPRFSGIKRTRGSFLKQTPSTVMRRNSSLTPKTASTTATPTPVGTSTGRGFVFQKGVAKPPSSAGSNPVEKSSNKGRKSSQQQKRPRLDRTISAPPLPADTDNSNSIFSILKY